MGHTSISLIDHIFTILDRNWIVTADNSPNT